MTSLLAPWRQCILIYWFIVLVALLGYWPSTSVLYHGDNVFFWSNVPNEIQADTAKG